MRTIDSNGKVSTAVVIAFPLRAAAAERLRARRQPEAEAVSVAYEDGWYHAEAIREDRIRLERDGVTSH